MQVAGGGELRRVEVVAPMAAHFEVREAAGGQVLLQVHRVHHFGRSVEETLHLAFIHAFIHSFIHSFIDRSVG